MIINQKNLNELLKVNCDSEGIEKASKIVQDGGIAVFPTDTVYGIGCNPYDAKSVKKIFEIKSRDTSKALPVLTGSIEDAEKIVMFDEYTRKIIQKFWPGPLTLILSLKDEELKKSLNLSEKIALRIPDNECILKLLKNCKYLVGTSANISGEPSFNDPQNCSENLQYDIFIDGGIIQSKGESTIVEINEEKLKILREGALSKEEIAI